jgi:hypothetical protein
MEVTNNPPHTPPITAPPTTNNAEFSNAMAESWPDFTHPQGLGAMQ